MFKPFITTCENCSKKYQRAISTCKIEGHEECNAYHAGKAICPYCDWKNKYDFDEITVPKEGTMHDTWVDYTLNLLNPFKCVDNLYATKLKPFEECIDPAFDANLDSLHRLLQEDGGSNYTVNITLGKRQEHQRFYKITYTKNLPISGPMFKEWPLEEPLVSHSSKSLYQAVLGMIDQIEAKKEEININE